MDRPRSWPPKAERLETTSSGFVLSRLCVRVRVARPAVAYAAHSQVRNPSLQEDKQDIYSTTLAERVRPQSQARLYEGCTSQMFPPSTVIRSPQRRQLSWRFKNQAAAAADANVAWR